MLLSQSATAYKISSRSDYNSLKYANTTTSKMAVVCHFESTFEICALYRDYCRILRRHSKFVENRTIRCRVMAENDVLQYGVPHPSEI